MSWLNQDVFKSGKIGMVGWFNILFYHNFTFSLKATQENSVDLYKSMLYV